LVTVGYYPDNKQAELNENILLVALCRMWLKRQYIRVATLLQMPYKFVFLNGRNDCQPQCFVNISHLKIL